ncbi:hypothetical protein DAEQUDRAFT_808264 [Daedalea quercina L-15889]|uniref:Uncharacterized protein n=1 Tax=Daedalea quercina L-15889 TaxID=1314783 RepID=A0A165TLI1_9APHY|nr:hypothetical protein DAEQUDRAFT_808264 [Daedalea quercina L-15889]
MSNQRYLRFTLSLLLTLYLYLANGDYYDFLAPLGHVVSLEVRYMCNGILLWSFIHFGYVAFLFILLRVCGRFPGLCHRFSRFVAEMFRTWVQAAYATFAGQVRRPVEARSTQTSEMVAEHLVEQVDNPSPASALLDAESRDAFEEWNDCLVNAGLCPSTDPDWQDEWLDAPVHPSVPTEPSKPVDPTPGPVNATLVPPAPPAATVPMSEFVRVRDENIRMRNELHKKDKEISQKERLKTRAEKDYAEQRTLSSRLQTQLEDAERREMDLQGSLARAGTEHAEKIDALNGQLAISEKRAGELERERNDAQALVTTLQTQLAERDNALATAAEGDNKNEDKITRLSRDLAIVQKQALRYKTELDARTENATRTSPRTLTVSGPRPALQLVPANAPKDSWGPTSYVQQLKRQQCVAQAHAEQLRNQAKVTIGALKEDLATVTGQRDELKAKVNKLQTEVDNLTSRNAALEQDVLDNKVTQATAEEQDKRLPTLLDQPVHIRGDAIGRGMKARVAKAATIRTKHARALRCIQRKNMEDATAELSSVRTALAATQTHLKSTANDLDALHRTIDTAYAPLDALMTERLAAHGLYLQRALKHDEKVTMVAEYALHLANSGAAVATAVTVDPMDVEDTPADSGSIAAMDSIQVDMASLHSEPQLDRFLPDVDMTVATPLKELERTGANASFQWNSQPSPVTPSISRSHRAPVVSETRNFSLFFPQPFSSTPIPRATGRNPEAEAGALFGGLDCPVTPTPKGRSGTLRTISELGSWNSPLGGVENDKQIAVLA